MEKMVAVEEARRTLGRLIQEVTAGKHPIVITRRTSARAVLLGYEEYERMRALGEQAAARRFLEALDRIHASAAQAKLSPEVVGEAIRKVRRS